MESKVNKLEQASVEVYQKGYTLLEQAIDFPLCDALLASSKDILSQVKDKHPHFKGNRGLKRYSLGSLAQSGSWLYLRPWVDLMNTPIIHHFLQVFFSSNHYSIKGGGGDVCLPGCTDYQPLHADISEAWPMRNTVTGELFTYGSFYDPRGSLKLTDLPCPYLILNIVVQDLTPENGPMRIIPKTHTTPRPAPSLEEEEINFKKSTLAGVKKGTLIIRDARTWHGGTPNISKEIRSLPNLEVFAPWYREPFVPSFPEELLEHMSKEASHALRFVTGPKEKIPLGLHSNLAWGRHLQNLKRSSEIPNALRSL